MNKLTLPALLAGLLLAAGCHDDPPAPMATQASLFRVPEGQRAKLTLVKVGTRPVDLPIELPAKVTFDELRTSDVTPLVDGKVARVIAKEGDRVHAGQALLAIASPDSADTQANLDRDQAALAHAEAVLTRSQDLYAHKAIALADLEQAQLDLKTAKASVASDRARVAITGTGPKLAMLRSPIDGIVVARHIAVGEAVQAGATPTFTITNPAAIWVVGQLYQEDLHHVAVGDPAEIRSPVLAQPIQGKVIYVGASLDSDTLTIPVRIAAENPDGLLKKGLYVEAAITSRKPVDELLVPADAVLRDDDNLPFVYVESSEPGSFARRHVTLGEQVGHDFVIHDGLKPGEQVIGNGALFVQFAESLAQ